MQDFAIPYVNKNYVKLSFFWQVMYLWNSLDALIRQAPTLNQFKVLLKAQSPYKPNKLYDYFKTNSAVQHARMRMGLSGLNAQRKKYNFIDYNSCPLCGNRPEDSLHFLLICPSLATFRQVMMRDICYIFSKLTHINFYNTSPLSRKQISNVLLYGSPLLTFDDNISIFHAVNQYIESSKRFAI